MIYDFIHGLVKDNVGPEGLKYFGFIFSLFLFVAFGNVLGLFPYAFTFTSHVAAVGTLSLTALLFNMTIGIKKKKWGASMRKNKEEKQKSNRETNLLD